MEKVFLWLYRTGCYFIPGGTALWCFVIENLVDKDVSVMAKIGCSGVFVLALMVFITIFFANKAFKSKNQKYEKEAIKELDNDKKKEIIAKWEKNERNEELFHNTIFLVIFICLAFLVTLLESKIVSLRGVLWFMVGSISAGLGCNVIRFGIATKNSKYKK